MDAHLAKTPFLAAGRFSVADIALYACTPVAEEGGFVPSRYPAVVDWLARVAAVAGHISMVDRADVTIV